MSYAIRSLEKRKMYTPDELYNKYIDYKDYCKARDEVEDITGFSLFANCSRTMLYDYSKKDEYSNTFEFIRDDMQSVLIQRGFTANNSRFVEYMLNNRYKNEFSNKQEIVTTNMDNKLLTADDRQALLDELKSKMIDVKATVINDDTTISSVDTSI